MVNKSPLHVLVVEDEPLLRWSIVEALSAAGHSVVEADDGVTALRQLDVAAPVDIVLLDYRLPDAADLSVLERIRQRLPRTPVVMMTAFGTPSLATGARQLGAYEMLDKPFDIYGLEAILQRAHDAAARPNTH